MQAGKVDISEKGNDQPGGYLCTELLPGVDTDKIVLDADEEEQHGAGGEVRDIVHVTVDPHQESEDETGEDAYPAQGRYLLLMDLVFPGFVAEVSLIDNLQYLREIVPCYGN